MKLGNGLQIFSLEKNMAQVQLKSAVRQAEVRFDDKLPQRMREIMKSSQYGKESSNFDFNFRTVAEILPKDEDYIFVDFRALSQVLVPGHWIDWTKKGVLQAAVPMLEGATVYANHAYWDINKWLGSVSQSSWDATGEQFAGVPGINATYKIDALVSPIIARGLLMQPPAIHSTSLTVLFEFEYSHPDIATEDRWKFMRLLGEEVDGHIVRLIVTKIHEIWEASLVYQGADRLAKQAKDQRETDKEVENLSAEELAAKSPDLPAPKLNDKEKTMKLTNAQKTSLGITADGEEFSETQILDTALNLAQVNQKFDGVNLEELQAKASVADGYLEEKRTEVRRLARLAELGAEEGDLEDVVEQSIAEANFARLQGLADYYGKKAADRFPKERSSVEGAGEIESAGGVNQSAKTTVTNVGLHD